MTMPCLVRTVNRIVYGITRHWLALVNSVIALILGLALVAPWLMIRGAMGPGQLLYLAYRPLCHQLPERSFFLGGREPVYGLAELNAHLGYEAPERWLGDPELGYKVAFCERDTAIYAGWLLAGLAFALLRRRLKPLPWQGLLLFMLPMAVDGTIQLLGILESDWWRRSITGLLFAVGVVWFAFPLLERGMEEAQVIARQGVEGEYAGER